MYSNKETKKIEEFRHASVQQKSSLVKTYYKSKKFRDKVKNTKGASWITKTVFALNPSSSGGSGPAARVPIETLPDTSTPSTMSTFFFDYNYIVNYNNTAGNPTDYTRYAVLSGISRSQQGGDSDKQITFVVERFEIDGTTPAEGPFFFALSNSGTVTSPSLPGTATFTEADMLAVDDSIIPSLGTVITQSNVASSNLSSATKFLGDNLTPATYYLLNNGDKITLAHTSVPVINSMSVSINGYLAFVVPKDPGISEHGVFHMYKRNNQIIRLTRVADTTVSFYPVGVNTNFIATNIGPNLLYGGQTQIVYSYLNNANPLGYNYYTISSPFPAFGYFTIKYESWINVPGGTEFTDGIVIGMTTGSGAPENPNGPGFAELTREQFMTISYIQFGSSDSHLVYLGNNPQEFNFNARRRFLPFAPQPLSRIVPYGKLRSGDNLSFQKYNASTGYALYSNGQNYDLSQNSYFNGVSTIVMYKRNDQVVRFTVMI